MEDQLQLDPNEKLQLQEGNLILLESKCRTLIIKEEYHMAENSFRLIITIQYNQKIYLLKVVDYFLQWVKNESSAFRLRAEILLKQGKFIQSLKDMEQAIALDPKIEVCQSSYEHYQIKKGLMKMSNDI